METSSHAGHKNVVVFEANLGMLSVVNSFRADENVSKINLAYMSTQQVKCVHETQNCLSPMLHMKPALR